MLFAIAQLDTAVIVDTWGYTIRWPYFITMTIMAGGGIKYLLLAIVNSFLLFIMSFIHIQDWVGCEKGWK
jgi:hypothetical protein